MNIAQSLQSSGAIGAMAREFNVDEATAQKAAGALLPAIVAGLGRDTVGAGGGRAGGALGGILGSILGGGGGAAQARDPLEEVLNPQPTQTGQGNDILGQIFGNKDVSRGVAEEAAASTGLPSALLKQMLPVLAMAVVGAMMKGRGGGMLGGILGQVVASAVRKAI